MARKTHPAGIAGPSSRSAYKILSEEERVSYGKVINQCRKRAWTFAKSHRALIATALKNKNIAALERALYESLQGFSAHTKKRVEKFTVLMKMPLQSVHDSSGIRYPTVHDVLRELAYVAFFIIFPENVYNRLLAAHYRFILQIARQYQRGVEKKHIDIEDLFHSGILGFNAALWQYDYQKGTKFLSYVGEGIKLYIRRHIENREFISFCRVPTLLHERSREIKQYRQQFSITYGRAPTVEKLSKGTGLSAAQIHDVLAMLKNAPVAYIEDFTRPPQNRDEGSAARSAWELVLFRDRGYSSEDALILKEMLARFTKLKKHILLLALSLERPNRRGSMYSIAAHYLLQTRDERPKPQAIGEANEGICDERVKQMHNELLRAALPYCMDQFADILEDMGTKSAHAKEKQAYEIMLNLEDILARLEEICSQ